MMRWTVRDWFGLAVVVAAVVGGALDNPMVLIPVALIFLMAGSPF